MLQRQVATVQAVSDVSLTLGRGETLGLVGESGCGKSTTGRLLLNLVHPTSGSVLFEGKDITKLSGSAMRAARQRLQIVFQDPYASLNPRITVGSALSEPLKVHGRWESRSGPERIRELLRIVGLAPEHANRYPHEFSGGQRQRVTIARAIAADPRILICDEAVSALDVSTQNQVIGLLEELSESSGLTYLFIAHDLSVVRHISDRVAVMYLGQIIEHGTAARVFDAPAHPYTEALLSAVPIPSPATQRTRERIVLSGDPPDPSRIPPGCRFHTRCPYVMDVCRTVVPLPTPVVGSGEVACHLHTTGPMLDGGSVRQLRTGVTRTPDAPNEPKVVRP